MRSGDLHIMMLAALAPVSLAAATAAPKSHSSPHLVATQKLIQNCDAHKFETVVDLIVDGQPHQSKVKLCGNDGQSDAEWIDTLRDAIKKLDANKDMPATEREQIVTAISSEIARLSILAAGPTLPRTSRSAAARPVEPLSRDYPTLPPLPPPPRDVAPLPVNTESAQSAPASQMSEIAPSAVKNTLEASPPVQPDVRSGGVANQPVLARFIAPRVNFGCDTPGELSTDAPCAEFERDTTIIVHAAEDVPAGTLLQFVRNDRPQADVALGGLRRGATLRVALPPKVCAGFTSGKLELNLVSDNGSSGVQPLRSEGPYSLRC